ncbi:MAG: periplasmic heavy metal sensor [Gammaproteobacteria bacterium]|jgi:uncharacterized membrane protein|nr:periplasmic heavy metal sensor [Gammaproteobacteria bacterium]MBT5204805.1 periplasmic heavy metal sensor [Gammaproteobacteria bacterium]MBT5603926.1 periplasmic heavy metal sensor [Gammaproteobacteria bacterium]MBT6245713.1 periplasmic heavy metal sensor [Gammaproteobacteria bacterium]
MNNTWIKWALIISLAINLILVGFEIAQRTGLQPLLSRTGPPPSLHPRMLDGHISKDTGRSIRRALSEHRLDAKETLDELHRTRRTFYRALLQSPLQEQQLTDANRALLKASTEYMTISQNNMIEIIKNIPAEERKQVLNRIERKFITPQHKFNKRRKLEPDPVDRMCR